MERTVETIADTSALAAELLASLPANDQATVFALHGDLGAGKTTFTQQLARLLGVSEVVTSPTFVVMKAYETTHERFLELVHIDAYRIEDPSEMQVLGFAALCQQPHIIMCVEWAERIADLLPADTMHLTFTTRDTKRIITSSNELVV